ncbi:hypothetical protein BX600DRAFT_520966 [Xylariales sp. PMI_506]|nr:hypothetical protein BX600DRAFT_520966 [Xylariales sp. PMI_506]
MSYSYHARRVFERKLIYQAHGYTLIRSLSGVEFRGRVDAWSGSGARDKDHKMFADIADDIILLATDEFVTWKEALRSTLVDHMIAFEIVVDELGRTSRGKLETIMEVFKTTKGRYDKLFNAWPAQLAIYKNLVLEIIEYMIHRCREELSTCSEYTPMSICYVDTQMTLEHALIIDEYTVDQKHPSFQLFPECFIYLYKDCVYALWNEEREDRAILCNDCCCGDALFDHWKQVEDETLCGIAASNARRKLSGGFEIKEKYRRQRDIISGELESTWPSLLGQYVEVCRSEAKHSPPEELTCDKDYDAAGELELEGSISVEDLEMLTLQRE